MFDRMQYFFEPPVEVKRFTTWKCKISDNDGNTLGHVVRQNIRHPAAQVWFEGANGIRLGEIRKDTANWGAWTSQSTTRSTNYVEL
jgi:hypothetical protein